MVRLRTGITRVVWEVPRSVKKRLKQEYSCAICGSREGLEVHHLDRLPLQDGTLRVNVLCKQCHKAVTYLEEWYPVVYLNVVKPYLLERAIVLNVYEIQPRITRFLR